jgi:6-phosphogluconolactonase
MCNSLAWSRNRQILYATCQVNPIGVVAAIRASADQFELINSVPSGAQTALQSDVNLAGTFLYVANYGVNGDSALVEFPLAPDGSILPASKVIRHSGSGPVAERQQGPHVHCATVSPDGRYVCVTDLGIDAIKAYPIDPVNGIDDSAAVTTQLAPGTGPRLLLFEPSGTVAYVVSELANTLASFKFDAGTFTPVKTLSTIPGFYSGVSKASGIRFSPDHKALLVSNRGYDSIAVFAIDGEGDIELKNIVYSIGQGPRDHGFIVGTNILVVDNRETNNAAVFEYLPDGYTIEPYSGLCLALPVPCGFES